MSIPSPWIFEKLEFFISPLEKSESIPSEIVFLIVLSTNKKFDDTKFIKSSALELMNLLFLISTLEL